MKKHWYTRTLPQRQREAMKDFVDLQEARARSLLQDPGLRLALVFKEDELSEISTGLARAGARLVAGQYVRLWPVRWCQIRLNQRRVLLANRELETLIRLSRLTYASA